MRKLFAKLLFLLVLWPGSAFAQEGAQDKTIIIADPLRDSYITVIASGLDDRISETGQPISIIGADEIALIQGGDIARVVERLPGVTLNRNGGPGAFTGVHVRGADAEQLLVLVDGVPVADPAAPANGFDFGTLLPGGIDKIELLRGSNSTIWGSEAMGGVLEVTTAARDGAGVSVEYGGPRTWYAQGYASRSSGPLSYGLDGAFLDSRGISAAAGGTEPDGVREWQLGGHAQAEFAHGLTVRAGLRHFESRLDLDGYPPPDYLFGDTAEWQDTRRTTAYAALDFDHGGDVRLRGIWSLSDTQRDSYDPTIGSTPTYTTHGRDQRVELRGKWGFANDFALHFGGEHRWSRFDTLFDSARSMDSSGAYAQLGFDNAAVLVNAGARLDDFQGFGSHWSFGADGAIRLGGGWRLRASYGEGFKAPSLFQRFSDYGNLGLRPELSRSFDGGVELGDRNAPMHFGLSVFRRDSSDLIDFVSCYGVSDGLCAGHADGVYVNVGTARAQGVELDAGARATDTLRLEGVYTYVEATNRTPGSASRGNDLARRPRHALTLSADWVTRLAGLALGADLRAVSASYDDAANLVRLDGYATGTLRASVPLTDNVELYGRIENLWNEKYQTVAGYGTPGRSAYVGARARW